MYNAKRTIEVFSYDLETRRRRTPEEISKEGNKVKKDLLVIDNCPSCSIERQIQYRASKKNTLCSKCFHNSPQMIEAKKKQDKTVSEETKAKMRANHWSKKGIESPFKGKKHTRKSKDMPSEQPI